MTLDVLDIMEFDETMNFAQGLEDDLELEHSVGQEIPPVLHERTHSLMRYHSNPFLERNQSLSEVSCGGDSVPPPTNFSGLKRYGSSDLKVLPTFLAELFPVPANNNSKDDLFDIEPLNNTDTTSMLKSSEQDKGGLKRKKTEDELQEFENLCRIDGLRSKGFKQKYFTEPTVPVVRESHVKPTSACDLMIPTPPTPAPLITASTIIPEPMKMEMPSTIVADDDAAPRTGKWTEEEDDLLRQAVPLYRRHGWKEVARFVPGRDSVQCLQRWQKVLQPGLVKGKWTDEEDAVLVKLVKEDNMNNWSEVAKYIEGRTAKQCRERWTLCINPDINRGPWTAEEDEIIRQEYARVGKKWALIKRRLTNRTENQVKTRFNTLESSRKKDLQVKWTPTLIEKVRKLAIEFDGNMELIRNRLPRSLKGISNENLIAHCPLIKPL